MKAIAEELLDVLKQEKLVLDWRKKQQTRAGVRVTIEEVGSPPGSVHHRSVEPQGRQGVPARLRLVLRRRSVGLHGSGGLNQSAEVTGGMMVGPKRTSWTIEELRQDLRQFEEELTEANLSVYPRWSHVCRRFRPPGDPASPRQSGRGFGVVVITHLGRGPRRNPNII